MENIFEKASRLKLRFSTAKGELSIEELWDLSLEDLDSIARKVNRALKDEGEESFIDKRKSHVTTKLELKLETLKHVISIKQEEKAAAKTKAEKKSQVEFLKTLREKKKIDQLESLDMAEIEKQIAELEAE